MTPPRVVLLLTIAAGVGCTLTLPFDSLTEGRLDASTKADSSSGSSGPKAKPPTPTSQWSFDVAPTLTVPDTFALNAGVLEKETLAASWTAEGKRGGGLDFGPPIGPNQASPWITVPTLAKASFPQEATVAMWVKVRSFNKEGAELFYSDDPGPGANADHAPIAMYLGSDVVSVEISSPYPPDAGIAQIESGNYTETASVLSFPVNTWALVVLGWSVSNKVARILVRPEGGTDQPAKQAGFPAGWVLKQPTFNFSCIDGVLDEVRYYDHLLSEAEMGAID
jgi:hypothetical protein